MELIGLTTLSKVSVQGFVSKVLDTDIFGATTTVYRGYAYHTDKTMTKREGIGVGISSDAVLFTATEFAKNPDAHGTTMVVLLPDTGKCYMSTPMFT